MLIMGLIMDYLVLDYPSRGIVCKLGQDVVEPKRGLLPQGELLAFAKSYRTWEM